jgi:lysophospholipase L1-like esterase
MKKIIFYLILFTSLLLILEGLSRITVMFFFKHHPQKIIMDDPILNHKFRPNLITMDGTIRKGPYTLITNKQSWVEDHDITPKKPANTYRIFYVGDSNTQGVVDKQYKMVEIVKKGLNARFRDKKIKFEVINTGTSSYSFILYYLLIKTKILGYSPDLVVINVDMTDIRDDILYRELAVKDSKGDIIAVPPKKDYRYILVPNGYKKIRTIFELPQILTRNSDFFCLLDMAIGQIKVKGALKDLNITDTWIGVNWNNQTKENIIGSIKTLIETINLLKEHNVKVFVTSVPQYLQFSNRILYAPHQIVKDNVLRLNVPYLDTYEVFYSKIHNFKTDKNKWDLIKAHNDAIKNYSCKYYWKEDWTHFNIEGNRVWAEAQLAFLLDKKNNLLPFDKLK